MSRYVLIRRLRGPAFLLLLGTVALLHQMGIVYHFWHLFWPLALILFGVLLLAERAALEMEGYPLYPGVPPVPGGTYPTGPAGQGGPGAPPPQPGTSIVPAGTDQIEMGSNSGSSGGQS